LLYCCVTSKWERNLVKRSLAVTAFAAIVVSLLLNGAVVTAASASKPKLSAMLLTIGQMPKGWSQVTTPPVRGQGGVGCYGSEPKGIRQTASATVTFYRPDGVARVFLVGEGLKTYESVETAYRRIVVGLGSCKHFSANSAGLKVTGGTVERMRFAQYGDASEAFAVSYTGLGMRIHQYVLFARKGTIVMVLTVSNLAKSRFQEFVQKAVAKLSPTVTK
jgi:hypothetical protein